MGNNSPSRKRCAAKWRASSYASGAMRSLTVGLRVAGELKLTDAETVRLLRTMKNELHKMCEEGSLEDPLIDRSVSRALQKLSGVLQEAVDEPAVGDDIVVRDVDVIASGVYAVADKYRFAAESVSEASPLGEP